MQARALLIPAAALALNAASAVQCHAAAVDYFLKIDGIDGESTNKDHKGEIELASFSWGVEQTNTISRGIGAGAGKVSLQDVHFTKVLDKATPKLFIACASGQHIKHAVLSIVRIDPERGASETLLKIDLQGILVSSVQESGSSSIIPADAVSMKIEKIQIQSAPTGINDVPPPVETNVAGE